MSLNVSLSPQLEKLVKDKVKSGRYLSSSEVVREGLRLLDERDRMADDRFAVLNHEIALGIEQIDRGEVEPWKMDEIMADVDRRISEERKLNQ
jgi:antitoxin ParD1/3/4